MKIQDNIKTVQMASELAQGLYDFAIKAEKIKDVDSKAKVLLNEQHASIITNLEVATLRKRRWQGLPPRFYKIGSKIRYDYFELQEFLSSCVRVSTKDEEVLISE